MLDGKNVKTTQTARPIAPDVFQSTGSDFTKIVKDTTNWHSTLVNGTEPNDTLWFWPVQGRSNTLTSRYNSKPDYSKIFLCKGFHTFRVKSLCSKWNLDCFKIEIFKETSLDNATVDNSSKQKLRVHGSQGKIVVLDGTNVSVYDIGGRYIGSTSTSLSASPGIYVVTAARHTAAKVQVR